MQFKGPKSGNPSSRTVPSLGRFSSESESEIVQKHQGLKEQLLKDYGIFKTFEDMEFVEKLRSKETFKKLAPIFLICLWVGISSFSLDFLMVFQHNKIARCIIPVLEDHFTFEQILDITVRDQNDERDQYCHYDNLNYEELIKKYGYNYEKIMSAISTNPPTDIIPCKNISTKIRMKLDDIGKVQNMYDYFDLYCKPVYLKDMLIIALKYGQLILPVPIAVIGDFYGRKVAFIIAGIIFSIGLFTILIRIEAFVIFGRFLMGTSMLLYYSVFVIYMERTNSLGKRRLGILLHLAVPSAKLIEYLMYRTLRSWYWTTICGAAFCLIMILLVFFIEESPRWLYFRGKKRTAYRCLDENHPDLPDEKQRLTLKVHLGYFAKPVFRKRVVINYLMIVCASSVQYLIRNRFSRVITNFHLKMLLDCGFFMALMTILTYFLLFFVKRLHIIISYFFVSSLMGAILFLNPSLEIISCQLAIIMQLSITENAIFFTFYCFYETYPTSFRLTAYGIMSTAPAFTEICHFHLETHRIGYKSVFYMPLFLFPSFSLAITNFLIPTKYHNIPDYPREVIADKEYIQMYKSMRFADEKNKL